MLSEDERATLTRWSRRAKTAQALAMRSRIVLLCSEGLPNTHVAQQLGVSRDMVGTWRSRFIARRLEGAPPDQPQPEQLYGELDELRARVAELSDWRRQIREHRRELIVGAAVAGFVVGGIIALRRRR